MVESSYDTYSINRESNSIVSGTSTTWSRKLPLLDIRKRMLSKHECLGIVRENSSEYISSLSDEQIKKRLEALSEGSDEEVSKLRERLQQIRQQRFFKVWHDHSTVAGHPHLLVLVAGVYDPAFYYTSTEMEELFGKSLDVESVVERPQLHIIGRSGSSLDEQAKFNNCRKECLLEMPTKLETSSGVELWMLCDFSTEMGQPNSLKQAIKLVVTTAVWAVEFTPLEWTTLPTASDASGALWSSDRSSSCKVLHGEIRHLVR